MKRITLVCFGKLRTAGFEPAVGEFEKRLKRYTAFEVRELRGLPVPEKEGLLRDQVSEKEADMILELISSPGFKSRSGRNPDLWCLDETGKAMKTTEWAVALGEISDHGSGELVLVIGGSLGLGDRILKQAQKRISFGPQTMSHELARLVLMEQLYRSLSFRSGHPYHNEG
jgi:23S rRNA (pseudouridine1915-N3)-methyltransferase